MMALIFAWVNYSVGHDTFREDQSDTPPLVPSDLIDVDDSDYRTSYSVRASPLLSRSDAYCGFDYHAHSAGTRGTPGLSYTITDIRAAILYDFCKDRLLHVGETPRSNDPEGYLVEFYEPVDAATWGAEEAYQLHWHPEGDALDRWLLCYDGRIVELSLDWEPTAEQTALIGEKLGR